jgi:UDP-N-acetyl-D-mannosaminuronic acid transferase (WecB/TagA/CpsF family)
VASNYRKRLADRGIFAAAVIQRSQKKRRKSVFLVGKTPDVLHSAEEHLHIC